MEDRGQEGQRRRDSRTAHDGTHRGRVGDHTHTQKRHLGVWVREWQCGGQRAGWADACAAEGLGLWRNIVSTYSCIRIDVAGGQGDISITDVNTTSLTKPGKQQLESRGTN